MIQQRVGDLLEVEEGGRFFYVVVLTKVAQFGGNILFAFHTDGTEQDVGSLATDARGFNICADLLLPKREGLVKRLHQFEDVSPFWRTRFVKATNEHRPGVRARDWYVYRIGQRGQKQVAHVTELEPKYRSAMDDGCHSFDLVAEKVLARYTPDQNEHI